MVITKEMQERLLNNYMKEHNVDECNGFIDGMESLIEAINKYKQEEKRLFKSETVVVKKD